MQEEIYTLDAKPNGMVAVHKGTNQIIDLPRPVYRNKQLLESELCRSNIKNYDIGFMLDGKYLPISDFQEIMTGVYQSFVDDTIVNVIPIHRDQLIRCGYFSFMGDPEEKVPSYKEGIEINKVIFRAMKEATCYMLRTGKFKSGIRDTSITYMDDDKIAPFKYSGFDNTCAFRIMRGFELIKVNEIRKSCGEFVFPFIGKFDKFKNIYFCFSKDKHEFYQAYYKDYMNDIIDNILQYLEIHYPELKPTIINLRINYEISL